MQPFTARVVEVIKGIPEGYVMTYGQIAAEAGSPRGARQVVRILHAMSESQGLPWHRVVNARGEIAFPEGEGRYLQQLCLEQEGVLVEEGGRVSLERYRYIPS